MRRKYLKSGVYLSMGIMVICLLFLLGKTPSLLNTMTELKQSPSNITIMLRTSVRMLSKVSGPSDKIKANTSSLLVYHYLIYSTWKLAFPVCISIWYCQYIKVSVLYRTIAPAKHVF